MAGCNDAISGNHDKTWSPQKTKQQKKTLRRIRHVETVILLTMMMTIKMMAIVMIKVMPTRLLFVVMASL